MSVGVCRIIVFHGVALANMKQTSPPRVSLTDWRILSSMVPCGTTSQEVTTIPLWIGGRVVLKSMACFFFLGFFVMVWKGVSLALAEVST